VTQELHQASAATALHWRGFTLREEDPVRRFRWMLPFAAIAWTAAWPVAMAEPLEGAVLVADEQFQIEDVLEEVLVRRPPGRVMKFWVVITGEQVNLATKANGMRDRQLAKAFDLVRQFGGIVYACENDMVRYGLAAGDLLPPTEPVKGFDADAPRAADARFHAGEDPAFLPESEAQLRRLRAACSARP
jgi:hypothetical protein